MRWLKAVFSQFYHNHKFLARLLLALLVVYIPYNGTRFSIFSFWAQADWRRMTTEGHLLMALLHIGWLLAAYAMYRAVIKQIGKTAVVLLCIGIGVLLAYLHKKAWIDITQPGLYQLFLLGIFLLAMYGPQLYAHFFGVRTVETRGDDHDSHGHHASH